MSPLDLDVIVVGSPRSGTTLLQRLASEVGGLRIPPETHFLSLHAPTLRASDFPMDSDAVEREVRRFSRRPEIAGLTIEVATVIDLLGSQCQSVFELFAALVRSMAPEADLVGEKTPEHLRWAGALLDRWPSLIVVGAVRDPRAVVASNLRMPFGMGRPGLLAERWQADVNELGRLVRRYPDRVMVLRYEDVVSDPDAARNRLAASLGRPGESGKASASMPLWLPWETWKTGSMGPVVTDRVAVWHEQLTDPDIALIEAVCAVGMGVHGYERISSRRRATRDVLRRARFRAHRYLTQRRIEALAADPR